MAERRPRGPSGGRPVLLLDWGVRGTPESSRISTQGLETWVVYCQQYLAAQCPPDMRLIACLAIEMPAERHGILEQEVSDKLRPRYHDRSFRLELLPRLDIVDTNDLRDFLTTTGYSSCPDGLLGEMPALIVDRTQGHFEQTVGLIEQAERSGWWTLHSDLTGAATQAPNRPPEGGTLL